MYGVVLIENAPTDEKEGRRLADKVAFIRKTHYGYREHQPHSLYFANNIDNIVFRADYHIKAKPGTQNVAYLSSLLQLHTDLPYYHYNPGVSTL